MAEVTYEPDRGPDCQHDWVDTQDSEDGLTRRVCQTCHLFAGFVQADGSVVIADGTVVPGHHTREHLQAIDQVLSHVNSRTPSLFDVLTVAGIQHLLPVNNEQREAIKAFIASIVELQAADSRFENCKRDVAKAFGFDPGCSDDIPF